MVGNPGCEHNFIQMSAAFLHAGLNTMCTVEWCKSCGQIRLVRQRGHQVIFKQDPSYHHQHHLGFSDNFEEDLSFQDFGFKDNFDGEDVDVNQESDTEVFDLEENSYE